MEKLYIEITALAEFNQEENKKYHLEEKEIFLNESRVGSILWKTTSFNETNKAKTPVCLKEV